MLNRRELLAFIASLAPLGAARTSASGRQAPDLNDPAANLRAFVKLIGSLDATPVYDFIKGSVYALVPGEAARPLFKTLGAGRASYAQRSSLEYTSVSRYIGLLLDWDTEETLRTWKNPYTGAACEVPVTRYGPGEARVLSDRFAAADSVPDPLPRGLRPWFRLGNVIHMQRNVILPAPALPHFPKADLMTYSGDWGQMADPDVKRMPSRLAFTAVETWRPWMRMDERDAPNGTLWWQVAGVKLEDPGDFPAKVRAQVLAEDATFFD